MSNNHIHGGTGRTDRFRTSRIGSVMERYSTVPTLAPASMGVNRKKLRGEMTVTSYKSVSMPLSNEWLPHPVPSTTMRSLSALSVTLGSRKNDVASYNELSTNSAPFSKRNKGYARGCTIFSILACSEEVSSTESGFGVASSVKASLHIRAILHSKLEFVFCRQDISLLKFFSQDLFFLSATSGKVVVQ